MFRLWRAQNLVPRTDKSKVDYMDEFEVSAWLHNTAVMMPMSKHRSN